MRPSTEASAGAAAFATRGPAARRRRWPRRWLGLVLGSSLSLFGGVGPAQAQVVFDDSLGASGAAPFAPDGRTILIEPSRGATRVGGGRTHLFFSFSDFSVGGTQTAEFRPDANIDTILSRVTGGNPSQIDGQIRVRTPSGVGGPDLFLLNPNGVIFGGDTRLDMNGALYVSTANALGFADGALFSAVDLLAPLPSTAAAPSLLRFDGSQAGDIAIAGRVISTDEGAQDAAGVTLVARHFVTDGAGKLGPEQATVQIAAVGAARVDVPLDLRGFSADDPSITGQVRIGGGSSFNVATTGPNPDQGRIVIRGGELVLEQGGLLAGGDGSPSSGAPAIDVAVSGGVVVEGAAGKIESLASGAFGPGGVRIVADRLTLRDGGSVEITSNRGDVALGRVAIDVGALSIDGEFSQIKSTTRGVGAGGAIDVGADTIAITNQARVLSESLAVGAIDVGPTGDILLEADSISLARGGQVLSATNDAGRAGDVTLRAERLDVVDSSRIASGASTAAASGDVTLEVGTLRLAGRSEIGAGPVAIGRPVEEATGPAGDVTIRANRARIEGGSQITTTTAGAGDAGNLTLEVAEGLVVTGELAGANQPSGLFARSGLGFGSGATGDGGQVVVRAGSLELTDGAEIGAQSFGTDASASPAAGGIDLRVANTLRIEDARISTDSTRPETGSVRLVAGRAIGVVASEITTNVDSTSGRGGDIEIATGALGLAGSRVTANADGANADAGDVRIEALEGIVQSSDSLVEARASLGVSGQVVLAAPDTNLAGELGAVATALRTDAEELRDPCQARRSRAGTFRVQPAPLPVFRPDAAPRRAPGSGDEGEAGNESGRHGCAPH